MVRVSYVDRSLVGPSHGRRGSKRIWSWYSTFGMAMAILIFLFLTSVFMVDLDKDNHIRGVQTTQEINVAASVLESDTPAKAHPHTRLPSLSTPHHFRIFIYDDAVPEALNLDVRTRLDCRAGYAAAEALIPELVTGTNVYTRDGELADFYIVPVLSNCYIMERTSAGVSHRAAADSLNVLFAGVLEAIKMGHPYWARSEGRDHIFIFPSERGPSFIQESILQQIRKSMLVVGPARRSSPLFDTWRDIVIPSPQPSFRWKDDEEPVQGWEGERSTLIHFRGTTKGTNDGSGDLDIRTAFAAALTAEEDVVYTAKQGCGTNCTRQEMLRSRFCLCPRGVEGWTTRIVEAIGLGCIPVIVADDVELPFESLLDYAAFSVKVLEADVKGLADMLRRISARQVELKQKALVMAWAALRYHSRWQPGDAFDFFLEELSQRVRFMRNSPHHFWRGYMQDK